MTALAEKPEKVARVDPNAPWPVVRVKDVASSIQYGHTASAVHRANGPRFLRITDIQDGRVDWDSVPSCDIPSDQIEKYQLAAGDLVFARTGATTGKSFLIGDCPEAVFASYLIRVRVISKVDPRYLAAYFQSPDYWRQIEAGKRGVGQPNVNGTILGEVQFPLPPLPEQRRIVAEIEQQFTRLDAGVAALRRTQANLKRYRAAVLKAACEGRLVPTDGPWCHTELGKAVKFLQGLQVPVPDQRFEPVEGDVLFLRIVNYTQPDKDFRYITDPGAKYHIQNDDVVMVRYGTPGFVGRGFEGVIANNLFRVIPQPSLSKNYLFYFLKSKAVADLIRSRQKGGTMQAISFGQLKDIPISIPPLAEQTRIVAEAERRLSVVDELESVVKANIQRATRLRQSILQQAFTGNCAPSTF